MPDMSMSLLTAAGDALTMVAATVMAYGVVYLGVFVGAAAFVGCALMVRLGVGR